MTAKEFVKSKYPKAHAERHQKMNGEVYFLIRDGNKFMYMASGHTQSNAWVNAKRLIK